MKKDIMKKVIGTLVVGVVTVVTVVVTQNFFDKNDEATDGFQYEIDFPQSAGYINPDLVTKNNIDKSEIQNEEILGTYYVVRDEISDSRKEHIKETFNMEKADVEIKKEDDITIEKYEKGDEQLTIYSNGTYRYKKNMHKDETQMKSVEFEESVLVENAEKFLEDKALIPGDFAYSKMGETVIQNLSTGEKKVVTKDLYFTREINGIEVEGTAKIVVSMNGDGEVEEIYSSYREIEETVAVKENYTVDEMVSRLKGLNGTVYINENADEVTLDNVEIIYYEDSAPYSDNITIQPIYRVRGSSIKDGGKIDEYLGLTSAVKR